MEIKSGIYTSEEQIKKVLSETFIDYFGEELRSVIEKKIENSTAIKYKSFQKCKTKKLYYKVSANRLNNKIFKFQKSQNFTNTEKKDFNVKRFLTTDSNGFCYSLFEVNNFDNPQINQKNLLLINKHASNQFNRTLAHEFAHAISTRLELLPREFQGEKNIALTESVGFSKRTINYVWEPIDKKWKTTDESQRRGTGLNEYLTEKVAEDINDMLVERKISLTQKEQSGENNCSYLRMDEIGENLFNNFGKELYRYAITGDFEELSHIMNPRELNEIIDRFDFFYKNYRNIVFPKVTGKEFEKFKYNFESSNMQLKKLIQFIIDRKKRKRSPKQICKKQEGIYYEC